jgi:hypothetical protein
MQRMNRTRRAPFNIIFWVSVLVAIAIAVLWVRSYRTPDEIEVGYWNYRPHIDAPSYRDADMVLALHTAGRWTIARHRRNCVALMPSVGYAGFYHRGPGEHDECWVIEHPAADDLPYLEREVFGASSGHTPWFLGFRYSNTRYTRALAFPDSALIALGVFTAAFAFIGRLMRRRPPGFCSGCGYDLRASPERCPECGRTVKAGGQTKRKRKAI